MGVPIDGLEALGFSHWVCSLSPTAIFTTPHISPSAGQRRQRFGQHKRTAGNVFRRGVLVGPMAIAVVAGNKQHARGRDPRHEQRVVIGATHHRKKLLLMFLAGLGQSLDYRGAQFAGASTFTRSVWIMTCRFADIA